MASHQLRQTLARCGLLILVSLLVLSFTLSVPVPARALTCAFKNPLVALGQDPSVAYQDGFYYLVQSTASAIVIKKAQYLTDLSGAPEVTVFTPPAGSPYSADVWAPELEYLNGGWYIYFAADDSPGNNPAHRLYVLQADTADPLGKWTFRGKVYRDAETDKWAIDGSVFLYKGQLYMIWSGWQGDTGDFPQNLYIAVMDDPLTVNGVRHQIATPDQPWEKSVQPIEEGPEPFLHGDQLSIVYSADASWSAAYKLGMLKLTGSDPLDATSWTKVGPIFQQAQTPNGAIYGPGHNSIPVKSPDGSQDWLVYHAKSKATDGWNDREILAQPFTWNADNTPSFRTPVVPADGVPLPSGQPCGLIAQLTLDGNTQIAHTSLQPAKIVGSPMWTTGESGEALEFDGSSDYLDLNSHLLNTLGSYSVSAWVQLDHLEGTYTIVSQEGGLSSEFALQYSDNKFALVTFTPQGDVAAQAVSLSRPQVGQWYHVTGVRDVLKGEMRLYVNGRLENTTPFTGDWETKGHTIIGAARQKSKRVWNFAGKIDEVILYNGALNDNEVLSMYKAMAEV